MHKLKTIIKYFILWTYIPVILFISYQYFELKIHVVLAADQVIRLNRNAEPAFSDKSYSKEDIDGVISQIENDYVSGTKQAKGSSTDTLVESTRKSLIRNLQYRKMINTYQTTKSGK